MTTINHRVNISWHGATVTAGRSYTNKAIDATDTMTIEIGTTVEDYAMLVVEHYNEDTQEYVAERNISIADLRAYLEQRDAYVAASTASRLGQSAQVEEVK